MLGRSNEWFSWDWIKQLVKGETYEVSAISLKSLLVSGRDYNILSANTDQLSGCRIVFVIENPFGRALTDQGSFTDVHCSTSSSSNGLSQRKAKDFIGGFDVGKLVLMDYMSCVQMRQIKVYWEVIQKHIIILHIKSLQERVFMIVYVVTYFS